MPVHIQKVIIFSFYIWKEGTRIDMGSLNRDDMVSLWCDGITAREWKNELCEEKKPSNNLKINEKHNHGFLPTDPGGKAGGN